MQQRIYQWTWLYTAICPDEGTHFSLYLPRLDSICYQVFLDTLSQTYPDDFIILVRDNAPAHSSKAIVLPDNIIELPLPPYSPELNPVERFFLELRRTLANHLFASIDALHDAMTDFLHRFDQDKEKLQLLSEFPWWWFAVHQLHANANT